MALDKKCCSYKYPLKKYIPKSVAKRSIVCDNINNLFSKYWFFISLEEIFTNKE